MPASRPADLVVTGTALTKSTVEARWADGSPRDLRWLLAASADGPWTELRGLSTRETKLLSTYGDHYLVAETTAADGSRERSDPLFIAPQQGNADVDWLQEAKYGISHHLLSDWVNRVATSPDERWRDDEDWDSFLDTFDVASYVDQVKQSGAGFVLLTLGQNSGYLIGPNAAYDRIAGLVPGERTPSRRDLPREIAIGLAEIGVKFMLYLPANPPSAAHRVAQDFAITTAFGPVDPEGVPSQTAMARWQEVIREYSESYGELAAGWWFDAVFPQMLPAYSDMTREYNWSTLTAAAKAGNPHRVVTYNIGLDWSTPGNPWIDYTSGELNDLGPLPNGRWADAENGVQWFALTYLGQDDPVFAGWGNSGTSKPTAELIRWASESVERGGVVCLDTRVNRHGRFDEKQLDHLEAVRAALRGR